MPTLEVCPETLFDSIEKDFLNKIHVMKHVEWVIPEGEYMKKSFIERNLGKLAIMDAHEFMRQLPPDSIDLIHTDPIWGVNFANNQYFDDSPETLDKNLDIWMADMERVLKDGRHIYIQVSTNNIVAYLFSFSKYFTLDTVLAAKSKCSPYPVKGRYKNDLQYIIHGSKGSPRAFEKVNIQPYSNAWVNDKRNTSKSKYSYVYSCFFDERAGVDNRGKGHPNEKSVSLIEKFILVASKPGEIILDTFAGSMSTAKAAVKHGRKYLTCDLVDWSDGSSDNPITAA